MTLTRWGHYPNKGVMTPFLQGHGDSRQLFCCLLLLEGAEVFGFVVVGGYHSALELFNFWGECFLGHPFVLGGCHSW